MNHAPSYPNKLDRFVVRAAELIPATLTWVTLIGAVVLSFIIPMYVALFVICFDLYWLIRAVYMTIHHVASYRMLKLHQGIDWMRRCRGLDNIGEYEQELREELSTSLIEKPRGRKNRKLWRRKLMMHKQHQADIMRIRRTGLDYPSYQDILHLIFLPTAVEGYDVLKTTLQGLAGSTFPTEQMVVILATEERTGGIRPEVQKVYDEFRSTFKKLEMTVHPDGIVGEQAGKGANATYAAKEIKKYIDHEQIPYENIIVTNFDSDTVAHEEYFAYLTYTYLTTPDRTRTSYQPLPVYNNNIWQAPAFARVMAVGSAFWQMIESIRPERLVTFSSHSMSWQALVDVGYWAVDMVSEDSRIFWQCYLHYNSRYRTVPMFINISMDTTLAETNWKTLKALYKQRRRWAWGIENFPYLVRGFMHNKKIPLGMKIVHLFRMVEGHHSWATGAFIIAVVGWLPLIFGGSSFEGSVLAYNLPQVARNLMSIAMIGLVFSAYFGIVLLPPRPPKYPRWYYVWMVLQWALIPFISTVLGSAPAIDAETRLMLGKYMGFWVTKKVRREGEEEGGQLTSTVKT